MAENANLKRRLRASFLFVCPTFARLRLRWLRWQCRRFVCLSSVLPQRQRTCTTTVVTALCARHAFQHRMAMVHTHCVWKQRLQLPLCLQAALHAPLGMRVCATDNAAPIAPRDTDDRGPRCIASAVACTPTQLAGTNAFSRSRCVGGAFAGTALRTAQRCRGGLLGDGWRNCAASLAADVAGQGALLPAGTGWARAALCAVAAWSAAGE